MERLAWPIHLLDDGEVRSWIAKKLPGISVVEGPIKIEQVKSWGVVARFQVRTKENNEFEIIFKASHLPLFTYGPVVDQLLMCHCPAHIPELLGWERWEDRAWMIYRPFSASRASLQISTETLCRIAKTMAHIQTRIAAVPIEELVEIPRTSVTALPTQFEVVLKEISERQWQIWHENEPWLITEFQIPADLIPRLQAFSARLSGWAKELAFMKWPDTIEHADLQADNAALGSDESVLLFDWEEASIGCPFFSIYRLLEDARNFDVEQAQTHEVDDGRYSFSQLAIRQAYIEAIPWGTVPDRARAFDLAVCLAPIRAIYDGILFAAAQGWPQGIPPQVAMLSSQALRRWEAFEHDSKTERSKD